MSASSARGNCVFFPRGSVKETVRLAEILEPLNGRLPVILTRLSRRVPRLPHGDGFRKHLFGRAVFAGADRIFDDALDPGGKMDSG